jgi:hypothetical protein
MKNFYLFFLSGLLCILSVNLNAQTLLVNDFESGLNGAFVAWGGSCEVIDNPVKDVSNNSDKILKIISSSYAPVGFPVSLPAGKTLKDYTAIRFQAMILPGSENIHWIGFNVGVSQNTSSLDLVDPTPSNGAAWGNGVINQWVDVELRFDETTLAQYIDSYTSGTYNVMIKLGRESFIYAVDNIRLVEKEVPANPNTILTFETMDLGANPRCGMPWSGTCSVVENSFKSGINSSNKCLQINGVECSPVTFTGALPTGKQWKDYNGLSFQFCVTNDPNNQKDWGACEVGIRLDNGTHIKIGAAYDENGQETAAYGTAPLNEWINVTLKIKEDLITEEANTAGTLYIRLMKNNLTYLIDNITLSPKSTTELKNTFEDSSIKAFGSKGKIKVEVISNKSKVIISTSDGKLLYSKLHSSGIFEINLPTGIYIVNHQKIIVF